MITARISENNFALRKKKPFRNDISTHGIDEMIHDMLLVRFFLLFEMHFTFDVYLQDLIYVISEL